MHKDKIYLVKMEVKAKNLKKALTTKGKIFYVEELPDSMQPEFITPSKIIGFQKTKTK
jgi:hypothetical protein